jgi:hypothetical protein
MEHQKITTINKGATMDITNQEPMLGGSPKEPSQVYSQIHSIINTQDRLENIISSIELKLTTVLEPAGPTGNSPKCGEDLVPLGRELQSCHEKLLYFESFLNDILNRIQL